MHGAKLQLKPKRSFDQDQLQMKAYVKSNVNHTQFFTEDKSADALYILLLNYLSNLQKEFGLSEPECSKTHFEVKFTAKKPIDLDKDRFAQVKVQILKVTDEKACVDFRKMRGSTELLF